MNIAIVGATGNVGRKIIEVLENKNFPISELFLIASAKSAGKKIYVSARLKDYPFFRNVTTAPENLPSGQKIIQGDSTRSNLI